jgi:hypothetical protein
LCVFCVRLFCVYIVSGETASRPKKRLIRAYPMISPLQVMYTVSKLAYRIQVILIANKRVKKKSVGTFHGNLPQVANTCNQVTIHKQDFHNDAYPRTIHLPRLPRYDNRTARIVTKTPSLFWPVTTL